MNEKPISHDEIFNQLDEFQAMDGDAYESNIRKQLKTVGMSKLENTLLSQLSGGEFKLLQVMKEMLKKPNLLIILGL